MIPCCNRSFVTMISLPLNISPFAFGPSFCDNVDTCCGGVTQCQAVVRRRPPVKPCHPYDCQPGRWGGSRVTARMAWDSIRILSTQSLRLAYLWSGVFLKCGEQKTRDGSCRHGVGRDHRVPTGICCGLMLRISIFAALVMYQDHREFLHFLKSQLKNRLYRKLKQNNSPGPISILV